MMRGMIRRDRNHRRTAGIATGILIIAFLLVGCAAARPAGAEFYKGKKVAPNEVIVKFREAAPQVISEAVSGQNVDETEHLGSLRTVRIHSRSKDVDTLIRELSARSDVEYVEPNYVLHTMDASPNDPYFGNLWGMTKIGAPAAWDISTGSPSHVVAVIDTGIDYTHPDLAGNVWSAPGSFTVIISGFPITCGAGTHGFNAITHTCDPMDDNSHGTHVSGTIGAVGDNGLGVAGVNWNTKIMGAKFLDSGGSGYLSDALEAIDFVIQAKQQGMVNARVLSNSWAGGGYSQALCDEIAKANDNGMLFVAAAGNSASNNDATPTYPSNYDVPNVVAVAATDPNDNLASFSNWGQTTVDLGAPGTNIQSTVRNRSYAYYSGTSMATPHVSGAAALVLSRCPLTTAGLKAALLSGVDPVSSLAGKTVTGGRLNVYKALLACTAPAEPDFSLSASPGSLSIAQGTNKTSTITVSGTGGFSDPVALSVSGVPAGVTAGLYRTSVTPPGSTTLLVNAFSAAAGTYTLTVTGTSGSLSRTVDVVVTITAPDFTLSASPSSRSIIRGSSTSYAVSISRQAGFTGPVSFSVSGLPSGTSGTFSPSTTTGSSSTLSIRTKSGTQAGTYTLTITGTSGAFVRSTSVTLTVRKSWFSGNAKGSETFDQEE